MDNIYNKDILEWCSQGVENAEPSVVIPKRLGEYLKAHNIPVKRVRTSSMEIMLNKHSDGIIPAGTMVNGVPYEQIIGIGNYFEMSPNVWRKVVSTKNAYKVYSQFLNSVVINFQYVYGKYVEDELIYEMSEDSWDGGDITEENILKHFCNRFPFFGYSVRTLSDYDVEVVKGSPNLKEYKGVTTLAVYEASSYIHLPIVGWRMICNDLAQLQRYGVYLINWY